MDDDLPAVGQLHDLSHLDASYSTITDAGLVSLAPLSKLEYLKLWTNAITGTGLAHLAHLQRLEYLDLESNPINDDGLVHLAKLRRLKELNLSESKITGSGLCHLAGMADLENLDLGHTRLNDEHLVHVANFPRLKHLSLDFTPVGDAELRHLRGLPNLKSLDLSETMVTDDGLDSLRSLTGLEVLDLSGTAITDKGLSTLGALTSLKTLLIDDSAATAEGAARLKRRLPKADIDFTNQGNAALNQARVLKHAGLWQRALEILGKLDTSYLESTRGLRDLGQCHAGLAQWDDAEREYCQVLEQISQDPSIQWWYVGVWRELDAYPELFERVARARPNDAALRVASAHQALLDSRWSAAIEEYSRAVACPHTLDREVMNRGGIENAIDFQYGVSCLFAGDVAEARRIRDRLLENNAYGNSFVAAHLQLWAPQGTDCPPQIESWLRDSANQVPFQALIDLRSGRFAQVLAQEQARQRTEGYGRYYWFSQAIAHHLLKHESDARECFARGRQWLNRRTKKARINRRYDWAFGLLEAEVLRQEAQRLIFN